MSTDDATSTDTAMFTMPKIGGFYTDTAMFTMPKIGGFSYIDDWSVIKF